MNAKAAEMRVTAHDGFLVGVKLMSQGTKQLALISRHDGDCGASIRHIISPGGHVILIGNHVDDETAGHAWGNQLAHVRSRAEVHV